MNKMLAALMVLCMSLPMGCKTAQEESSPPVEQADSETLKLAFAQILEDYVVQVKDEKGSLPPDATSIEFVPKLLEELNNTFPEFFQATAAQEERFQAGVFPDAANKKKVDNAIQQFAEYDVALPSLSIFLITEFNSDELQDARLEFAARLLTAQADLVQADASDTP